MPVLISAVVLVGVLCAVDLVLTLAVIRRLRDHSVRLAEMGPGGIPELPAPGTRLGEFTAIALDGKTLSHESFTGPTVVGVFSTSCPGCHERLPEFAAYLAANDGRPALAVVKGEPEPAREFIDVLGPLATVVVEPMDGSVSQALRVTRVPAFYVVEDAVIVATAGRPAELTMPAVRA